MSSERELNEELLSLYRRTGEAAGYWPSYFLRSVRKHGGLAIAKKLLRPGATSSGFGRLIESRRVDLSVEAIALEDRFRGLFSFEELEEARRRLDNVPATAFPRSLTDYSGFPDEVEAGSYKEGAVQRVLVNRYERDPRAREVCIRHHGTRCLACDFDFEENYGEIGIRFIHVHHKRPLSKLSPSYRLDPKKDLVPVCPNCHAMLHRRDPPYDVEQLRDRLRSL